MCQFVGLTAGLRAIPVQCNRVVITEIRLITGALHYLSKPLVLQHSGRLRRIYFGVANTAFGAGTVNGFQLISKSACARIIIGSTVAGGGDVEVLCGSEGGPEGVAVRVQAIINTAGKLADREIADIVIARSFFLKCRDAFQQTALLMWPLIELGDFGLCHGARHRELTDLSAIAVETEQADIRWQFALDQIPAQIHGLG